MSQLLPGVVTRQAQGLYRTTLFRNLSQCRLLLSSSSSYRLQQLRQQQPLLQLRSISQAAAAAVTRNTDSPGHIPPQKRPLSRAPVPPPTKTEADFESMPYAVRRTPYAQLPIYRKWMAGGSLQMVLIKKIGGDSHRLVRDLVEALELDPQKVRVNPVTRHVEVKGDLFYKIRDWLLSQGF